jgi:hypothetical protein
MSLDNRAMASQQGGRGGYDAANSVLDQVHWPSVQ